jgi:hypothetical protein
VHSVYNNLQYTTAQFVKYLLKNKLEMDSNEGFHSSQLTNVLQFKLHQSFSYLPSREELPHQRIDTHT